MTLYVDERQALLMVLFVSVGVSVALANLLIKAAPLILLTGTEYLSGFTTQQMQALALGALRLHSGGTAPVVAFWGGWLLPLASSSSDRDSFRRSWESCYWSRESRI